MQSHATKTDKLGDYVSKRLKRGLSLFQKFTLTALARRIS